MVRVGRIITSEYGAWRTSAHETTGCELSFGSACLTLNGRLRSWGRTIWGRRYTNHCARRGFVCGNLPFSGQILRNKSLSKYFVLRV